MKITLTLFKRWTFQMALIREKKKKRLESRIAELPIDLRIRELNGQTVHVNFEPGLYERPFDMALARKNVRSVFGDGSGNALALLMIIDLALWRGVFREVSPDQVSTWVDNPTFVDVRRAHHPAWHKVPGEIGIDGNNFERLYVKKDMTLQAITQNVDARGGLQF